MNRTVLSGLFFFIPALVHAQCDRVAVVFDTTICQSDIAIPDRPPGAGPMPPERKKEIENNRLARKIRQIAAEHLLAKESYTPTQSEIDSYAAFFEQSKQDHARQNQELIETIESLLKTYQYTPANRKRLKDALAVFRTSAEQSRQIEESNRLRDEDMRRRYGEDSVKKLQARMEQGKRRMHEQWVARWKMNKALYEKYGGRVIFQQAGIEPIDAYRAQLKAIREKGGLQILEPEYGDVFRDFERYLDMGHNYLSENGDKYFDQPYWETADLEENHRRALEEYKRIPHE
jgi:hypothetical protein